MRKGRWLTAGAAVLLVIAAGTFGCAPHSAYRVPEKAILVDEPLFDSDAKYRSKVETHCVEILQSHPPDNLVIGYVEFDDQGDLWNPGQWTSFHDTVRERFAGRDVIIVTFVHGWKHNASVCDGNVTCFREVLKSIENSERYFAKQAGHAPRPVVGLYAGWRGLSLTWPIAKETSFYARKSTAHRVGNGRLRDLFVAAEGLRDEMRAAAGGRSRLIIVGHSFGAAATFSALGAIFQERVARFAPPPGAELPVVQGFGDAVVLVNPAFEATLYSGLDSLMRQHQEYSTHQRGILLTVGSETDSATQKAFPVGRFFNTLFERTQNAEQEHALRTTLGNYEKYRTHLLKEETGLARGGWLNDIEETDPAQKARSGTECKCAYLKTHPLSDEDIDEVASREEAPALQENGDLVLGNVVLKPVDPTTSPYLPLIVARASDAIVTQHNGIYNKKFLDFLRAFLIEMERRNAPPAT